MKAELPFEITPITLRYLHELAEFFDDFPTAVNPRGARIQIFRYKAGEQPTQKTELNASDFWEHLKDTGAVSVTYPDKKDIVMLTYSNIDESLLYPQYCWVSILKIEPVRELLEIAEKQARAKTLKGKVEWNSQLSMLSYKNIHHNFHRGEKKDAPTLKIFTELWNERRSKDHKGMPLEVKALAARTELSPDRREGSLTEEVAEQIHKVVKGIRRVLKDKGFPIRIRRVSNSYQLEVTE